MIDWYAKAAKIGQVEIVIDGVKAVARAVPASVFRVITAAHPAPGVPTDENEEPVPQDPDYLGRAAAHRQDMVVLESAACMGFVTRGGLDIRSGIKDDNAKAWVQEAIAIYGAAMDFVDHHTIITMVRAATSRIGADAKNSSSSSPKATGSTPPPSDSPTDAPSST